MKRLWARSGTREVVLDRQVGTTTRIRVRDADGQRFIKRPSALVRARAITEIAGVTAAEVRFYDELARELPVRIPKLVRARHRPWGFELVLEDLVASGCTMIASGSALSVDEVRGHLRALATLHARFWEDPRFERELLWLTTIRRREVALGEALARPLMELGLLRAGPLVPSSLRVLARRYARERSRVSAVLARGPRTLVHHDCHPGNLFWDADGEPGFLDWQMVRCASWASDVAYLFATGLATSERLAHADELLGTYLAALPAALRPSFDEARELVRVHTAYAFEAMVITLAVGGLMLDRDARRLVRRTALAAADEESFQRLGLAT